MSRRAWVGALLAGTVAMAAGAGAAWAAPSEDNAEKIKQLEDQRRTLEKDTRDKLRQQILEIQAALAGEADLADLRKAVQGAQTAYDQTVKADAKIAEADKAAEAAAGALAEAEKAAAAGDAQVKAAQEELEAAYRKRAEAESAQRLARFLLGEVWRRLSDSPALAEAEDKVAELDRAVRELPRTNPQLAAARKKLEDARAALEARFRSLPEYQAVVEAQKAYDEVLKTDPAVQALEKQRDEARNAFRQKVDALVADDAEGSARQKKLDQAEQLIRDAQKHIEEAQKKAREAVRTAVSKDPKVAEAKKASDEARAAARKTADALAQAQRKALEDASRAFQTKLNEKLAANAKAAAIVRDLEAVNAKIKDLDSQLRDLRGPRTEK